MSNAKLTVIHKKISKFLKRKVIFLGSLQRASQFRNGALLCRQQRPTPKEPNANLWNFCRYSSNARAVCSSLSSLNFRTHHSRILSKVVPHRWKEYDGNVKTVWSETAGDAPALRFSRGFSVKRDTTCGGTPPAEVAKVKPAPKLQLRLEEQREIKPVPKPCTEVEEQCLYTHEESPIRSYAARKRMGETEKTDVDFPLLQHCRLSCPLPPPDFLPPEKTDFIRSYQPPSVRSLIYDQPKDAEAATNHRMKNRVLAPKPATKRLSEEPEFMPTSAKRRKNYIKVRNKSQMYPREEGEPRMKALLFDPVGMTLSCETVRVPTEIFKDEVLIQVSHSGVCGYDYFLTEGRISCGGNPVIPGREISGTVYAAGTDIRHVMVGDKVAVNPFTACSVCRFCSRGLCSACLNEGLRSSIGTYKNGGWAEFVVVKKSQVHKIPEELGMDQATLIQPLSCVLSAMSKLKLFNGMTILIQGLGLSGCLWASVLHSRGYRNVLVTEKSTRKRRQFESLNLNYGFLPPEDLRQVTADIVIECTGSPITIEKSLNILNPKGQMCFFGKPSPVTEVRCIPYDIIQREITIFGTTGNAFSFTEAIDVAASLGSRYLDLVKLGVQTFELEQYREAFQMKKSGEVNKVIFKFDS